MNEERHELAARVMATLTERAETVAVAESLTGGLLAAALVEVPGASAVLRGGIVAYATDLKAALLGVPQALLDQHGAVHPDVAAAMADGVRTRLNATYGLATTGVAGPDPADGQPVGTVFIAVSGACGQRPEGLRLSGGRASIRAQTVVMSLKQLLGILEDSGTEASSHREEDRRLQCYVLSEHTVARSRRRSVRAGTVGT